MRNNYHILNKQPKQTWESWLDKKKHGSIISVPFNYRFDNARKMMARLVNQGFFKRKKDSKSNVFERIVSKQTH